jgi:predicted ATPase/DNA-binding SARP family transcriptional activator
MGQLALSFLGPWQVTLAGEANPNFKYDKVRALLAYLALESDRPHRREALMGLLWPELPETAARNNLRQVLVTLRQAIGDRTADPPYLLTSRATIQFNPDSDFWLDVATFTSLLDACQRHAHRSPDSCKVCAWRRQQAVELYRGPFLADFYLPDSVAFEEWALVKREWLNRKMLAALDHLIAYHERRGQYEPAQSYARQQLELEPWREEAHRQLMRLHLLTGQRTAALAQYEQCRRVLDEELGVEPEAETTALYEQIRDASDDEPLRPERLALPSERPHTLPPHRTPFIGREAELAEIGRLLAGGECHLLTLTGPGGIGKTRLALQAAAEHLDAFADGVFFVPLATLNSAGLLAPTIADALKLQLRTAAEPDKQLLPYLSQKEMLLVLDNFEHLLVRAKRSQSDGVELLAAILRQAPEVTLLVTSRERLNLQDEWIFAVEGLPLPQAAGGLTEVEENDAVQLFIQSARRVRRDFALTPDNAPDVVRICQLATGLPLAIKLAAAWVRALSCRAIVQEIESGIHFLATTLRDVPDRHRSLVAVFDHSWRLLAYEEQALLAKLAVFQGGFRRQAAEQVAGATARLLAGLVDKSLLRHTLAGRYEMHEMIRQYAGDKLAATGEEAAVQRQHTAYYLALAETAEPQLTGAEQEPWLARLEEEHDNLRLVLQGSLAEGDVETAARISGAIWRFWQLRGHLSEGRDWLARVLGPGVGNGRPLSPLAQARALKGAGVLAWMQADYQQSSALFETSLDLFKQLDDKSGVASVTKNLGTIALHQGVYEQATALLQKSLGLRRELEDNWGIVICLNNLGATAGRQGKNNEAQHYYEEALALSREQGYKSLEATLLTNLGDVANTQDDVARAEALYRQSLALRRQLGDKLGVALSLDRLAEATFLQDDIAGAYKGYSESLALFHELGDKEHVIYCVEAIACLATTKEMAETAGRLWGAAEALRQALGTPAPPSLMANYEPYLATARQHVDPIAWEAAWAKGRAMSLAQAMACALTDSSLQKLSAE